MQVCDKCKGEGTRLVELSNGEKVKKPCYLCGGKGVLSDARKKVSKVKKIKKQPRPEPAPERQGSGQKPLTGLSVQLGDLSWMKGRKTHG